MCFQKLLIDGVTISVCMCQQGPWGRFLLNSERVVKGLGWVTLKKVNPFSENLHNDFMLQP